MDAHLINCPKCGQSIPELSATCEFCGVSITPNEVPSAGAVQIKSAPIFQKPAVVSEMKRYLEPMLINFGAKTLMVMLSPTSVKKLPKPPGSFTDRAELKFNIKSGAYSIHADHWVWTSYGESKNFTLSIYESSLKFPLNPSGDGRDTGTYEVVEVAIPGGGNLLYKRTINATGEKLTRITTACSADRYWLAVPSQLLNNSFRYGSFHIDGDLLKFTNRTYARLFAELNHIEEGRWFTSSDQSKKIGAWWSVGLSFIPLF